MLRSRLDRNRVLSENNSFTVDVMNQTSINNRARWRLIPTGEEHVNGDVYYLQNIYSTRVLEVRNGIYNNAQELITWPLTRTQRQRFVIHREDS